MLLFTDRLVEACKAVRAAAGGYRARSSCITTYPPEMIEAFLNRVIELPAFVKWRTATKSGVSS